MPRLKDLGKTKDAFLIPLEKLKPGDNIRKDFSSVPDLAISLHNCGQLTPIEVRLENDKAIITDGERRYRAAIYANKEYGGCVVTGQKFTALLCVAEPTTVDPVKRIFRQLEHNDQVQPLSATERATAYKKLVESGVKVAEIARQIGKTAQSVSDTMKILEAPTEVRKAVEDGKMSATAASKVSRASPEKQKAALEKVQKGERVKVSDVAEYVPLGLEKARELIKRCEFFRDAPKVSEVERMRWGSIAHGIEIGVGLRPAEFE
jgi:ParB family chromosome partitioning protein